MEQEIITSNPITVIDGTEAHFEATLELCDERYGTGYCTREVFDRWVSNPGLLKVALYNGEYAGFAVMLPASVEEIMDHMKMTREQVEEITQGKPALIYKSAAVRECFGRRGIMKTMATIGLKQAKEMGYHSIFGSAWYYNDTIPIEGTFRAFGFQRLFERKKLWYDDENYYCIVCKGRCVCDGIIYYRYL